MESKKYFVMFDNEQKGPFGFSELATLNLTNQTPIWHEGMTEWATLEEIEELKSLKKSIPPIYNLDKNETSPINYSAFISDLFSKNKLFVIIILIFVVFSILLYPMFNTIKKDEYNNESKSLNEDSITVVDKKNKKEKKEFSPEELRQKLLNKEIENPLKYLNVVELNMTPNEVQIQKPTMFRHSKWEVDGYNLVGNITNNATLASFKDIELKVDFFSKTKSKIVSINFVIYDFVNPNGKINFTQKVYPPEGTISFEVSVLGAKN